MTSKKTRLAVLAISAFLLFPASQALALGKSKQTPPSVPPALPSRAPTALRIVSYNIWGLPSPLTSQPSRLKDIAKNLPGVGADVIGFQETFTRKAEVVAEMPDYPYVAWGKRKNGNQVLQGDGLLIVSRWPILETDHITYTACSGTDCFSRKGALYAKVHVDGFGEIDVFDTHLNAGGSESVRIQQMREFGAFIESKRGDRPVFVTGDFNTYEGTEEYAAWKEITGMRDMHDEFRTYNPVSSSVQWNSYTLDPKRNEHYKIVSWFVKPHRIDFIWVKDPAGAVTRVTQSRLLFDYKINKRTLSDHFGIVMDFVLQDY